MVSMLMNAALQAAQAPSMLKTTAAPPPPGVVEDEETKKRKREMAAQQKATKTAMPGMPTPAHAMFGSGLQQPSYSSSKLLLG